MIAPDLIGMGDSDKLADGPDRYTFVEHRRYLDALLGPLGVSDRVTLVLHDWGSSLGFDWANRHRDAVRGHRLHGGDRPAVDLGRVARGGRAALPGLPLARRRRDGARATTCSSSGCCPASVLRTLDRRRRWRTTAGRSLEPGEDRRPTLTWPRQIPIDGEPADVVAIVADYAALAGSSDVPKLFVNAEPGAILLGAQREFCRAWPNQTEVTVAGIHFLQEDSPDEIGRRRRLARTARLSAGLFLYIDRSCGVRLRRGRRAFRVGVDGLRGPSACR